VAIAGVWYDVRMSVEVDLKGQIAVVTGGGGGIGAGISRALANAGATVVVAEIDPDRARDTVDAITADGGTGDAVVVDVRERTDVDRLAEHVLGTYGHIDILVNNVGHYIRPTPFLDGDDDHWDALDAVNLRHVFRCTKAFAPSMVERGVGAIVNVASVEGLRGYPADPVYGAYKAAVAHFTRCLALELAPNGVRVNAIAPDVTQSLQVDYEKTVPEELRDRWPIWVPVGRVGDADDNADVVLFLASELSRFMIGQVLPTDGGTLDAGGWFRTTRSGRWTNRPRDP
jgi:NAD(P)-dependent dehydrogenase (short-subunit alcohol dehydrogenase family)